MSEEFKTSYSVMEGNSAYAGSEVVDFNPDCIPAIKKSDELISNYFKTFANNQVTQSDTSFQQYQTILQESSVSCRDQIIENAAIKIALSLLSKEQRGNELVKLLYYLQRKHRVSILTPEIRNSYPILRNNKVLGAYSCVQNKIWLSSNLRFFNLGTVYIHELEHWARSLVYQYYKEQKNTDRLAFLNDPTTYYLFDEALSSITASYVQLSIRNDSNRENSTSTYQPSLFGITYIPRLGHFFQATKYYQLNSDLNLYNQKGYLTTFWNREVKKNGIELNATESDFLRNHFLDSRTSEGENIFKSVESVYLPSENGSRSSQLYTSMLNNYSQLEAITSPLNFLLQLTPEQWAELDDNKKCELNTSPRTGGEGTGTDDSDVRLDQSEIRACLEPTEGL